MIKKLIITNSILAICMTSCMNATDDPQMAVVFDMGDNSIFVQFAAGGGGRIFPSDDKSHALVKEMRERAPDGCEVRIFKAGGIFQEVEGWEEHDYRALDMSSSGRFSAAESTKLLEGAKGLEGISRRPRPCIIHGT